MSLRALRPEPALDPRFLRLRSRLPESSARVFFVNAISLLPGTFSADLHGAELTVHLLARSPGDEAMLRELESRVGAMFGVPLEGDPAR